MFLKPPLTCYLSSACSKRNGRSRAICHWAAWEKKPYTQLFNLLCEKADDVYGGRLPVHVRCLIDEAANIGQIPRLEKLVATIRSREISCCLVLQAQSQLKAIYKDNADTIIGNMDTSIFLGGKEPTTLKELSAALGKETIDTFNTGESRGREVSHSLNYQKLGKELMSQDELAVMDGGKCVLQLRGVRPFLSNKYDIGRPAIPKRTTRNTRMRSSSAKHPSGHLTNCFPLTLPAKPPVPTRSSFRP